MGAMTVESRLAAQSTTRAAIDSTAACTSPTFLGEALARTCGGGIRCRPILGGLISQYEPAAGNRWSAAMARAPAKLSRDLVGGEWAVRVSGVVAESGGDVGDAGQA